MAQASTGLEVEPEADRRIVNIRYPLCNADEMELGTYRERPFAGMEQLPHLLVEGMPSPVCAESLPWRIFCAANISKRQEILYRAIAEATKAGLLGKTLAGNRFRFRTVRPYWGRALTSAVKKTALD